MIPPQYFAQKSRRQRTQWIKRKSFMDGLRGTDTHAIGRFEQKSESSDGGVCGVFGKRRVCTAEKKGNHN